jgi:16S rRNA (cytidine1402-2'-O)-methyltransferase
MPGLSDPGFRLIHACSEEGIPIRVVPGPSAATAALVVSGLPSDRFVFEGFLPRRDRQRRARLAELADDPRTIVLFESPRRVRTTLSEVSYTLGDRRVALARELTKLHEEVIRGTVSEVLARVGERDPKGEVVLVVEGAPARPEGDLDAAGREARRLLEGGLRPRAAAAEAAKHHGVHANDVYRLLVKRT